MNVIKVRHNKQHYETTPTTNAQRPSAFNRTQFVRTHDGNLIADCVFIDLSLLF